MSLRMIDRDFSQSEWDDLFSGFADQTLLQTWAYGEAKRDEGWLVQRAVFEDGDAVVGMVQAGLKPMPVFGGGLVWINRGPLWRKPGEDGDRVRLAAMLDLLRARWGKGCYLRIGPPVETLVPPLGYKDTGRLGWASATLDLSPDEEALRKGLKQKWRNVVNKAERQDIAVSVGHDPAEFTAFLDAHAAFMEAKAFGTSLTRPFLERLRDLGAPDALTTLIARDADGAMLGSTLIGRYGDTVEYLAGNTTDLGRKNGVGQLLLWRAIAQAKADGARIFDLGGQDEARTPAGILKFKQGVNGTPYRLCSEIEATSGPLAYVVRWKVAQALAAAD